MTIAKKASLIVFLAILVSGCNEAPLFDSFVSLNDGWQKDSILEFNVRITDAGQAYLVNVKMRHNGNYPYSNIYMFRKIESANGVEYQDTVNFVLADPTGKWLGSGVGELKTMVWTYRANALKFNEPGNYTFSLQQGMRTDVLPGIEDVGLEVIALNESEKNGSKTAQ